MATAALASSAKEVLPPSLTSTSEPPPIFDGTTRLYVAYHFPELQVAIDLADRPAWYKEKIYPENKVGLLNVDGFYDPLLLFIDLAVNEGFITEEARHIIISAPTAKELVMKLEVGNFDPVTREPLKEHQLVPNLAIKEAVQAYLKEHSWAYKLT